jgi:L-amino acid N-acyltransferase YncA
MIPDRPEMPGDRLHDSEAPADATGGEPAVMVRPSRDGDVEAMLAIYRHHIRRGIEEGVADSGMPQPDDLRDRRKNLRDRRFPHLVATLRGEVLGYAYVVLFRKRPAYRYTVKHSIYVHHAHLGRGVGRLLMAELIDACAAAGFRQMIGYIDADNAASLALHEKFGFTRVGYLPGVAYRYGRWADSVMVQRSLGPGTTAPPPAPSPGR